MFDLDRIKRENDILDLARELGVEIKGRSSARCIRPENHRNGDRHPSMWFNIQRNTFGCFVCNDVGGTVIDLVMQVKGLDFGEAVKYLADRAGIKPKDRPEFKSKASLGEDMEKKSIESARIDLNMHLQRYQEKLDTKWARRYLKLRGISFEVAQECGLGYAPPGEWIGSLPNPAGAIVFPLTDPEGRVINLHARLIGVREGKGSRSRKFDNLMGSKAIFNAKALNMNGEGERVYICEGPFDALSLIEGGKRSSIALMGRDLKLGYWQWFKGIREVVICPDSDPPGQEAFRNLAWWMSLRGKKVLYVPAEAYEGCKDLNEYWRKRGRLPFVEPREVRHSEE